VEGLSRPLSEADENAFSDGLPAFLVSMRTPEIGCIQGAEVLLHCIAQAPLVEKIGRLVQQIVLLDHVLGFEHRSRKHEFPMDRNTLAFEGHNIELLGVVDHRDMAFRGDSLSDRGPMLLGRGQACHHINGRKPGIDQRLVRRSVPSATGR